MGGKSFESSVPGNGPAVTDDVKPAPPQHRCHPPGTKEILLIAVLGVAFTTVWAIVAGKGVSWDEKNYHHYNAYALLAGRRNYDLAPAGQHSWLNPFVYVPQYWLVNHVPPVVAGGIFGAWVGLNFALVYALVRLVVTGCAPGLAMGLAVVCALVGFSDPAVLGMIGATDVDTLLSLPVLASLCILCRASRPEPGGKSQNRAYAIAGILLGVAAGLKWTCFVWAAGMGVTLLLLWPLLRMNRRRFLWFAGGGVLGYLPAGGAWNWILWSRFRNPFFPYWNRYFHSGWAVNGNFRDMRFPPRSVESALTYPFQWFVGLAPSSEAPFRDARFALLSVLIPILLAALAGQWIFRRWAKGGEGAETRLLADRKPLWLLLTFAVVSYSLWIYVFAIQRYLPPLGLLSGLLLLLSLDWLLSSPSAKLAAFFFLALFCLLWMRVELGGWRLPYGSSWFGLELAPEVEAPGTLFVMVGDGPMGYVVPYLPESTRTVRLHGSTMPESETEMIRRAREILSQHTGPIRSLSMGALTEKDYFLLARFGLALDEDDCAKFRSADDQFASCRVIRQPGTGSP